MDYADHEDYKVLEKVSQEFKDRKVPMEQRLDFQAIGVREDQ
jgi:hypothetical protein